MNKVAELDEILEEYALARMDFAFADYPDERYTKNEAEQEMQKAKQKLLENYISKADVLEALPKELSLDDLEPNEKINRVEYAKFCVGYNQAIKDFKKALRLDND